MFVLKFSHFASVHRATGGEQLFFHISTFLKYFFHRDVFVLKAWHFPSVHPASTAPVAAETRSMIISFIVCGRCVYLRAMQGGGA